MTVAPEARLARSTLGPYLRVAAGESVTVEAWSPALGWARAFVVESRRLGATPTLLVEDEEAFFRALAEGGPVPRAPAPLAQRNGAHVYLEGPDAFHRLFGLRWAELRSAWSRHSDAWATSARALRVRGARVRATGLTSAAAARYQVDLAGWRGEILEASVVPPARLAGAAAALARRLVHARRFTVTHPNGTRLEFEVRPEGWVEESGRPVAAAHRPDPVWMEIPTGRLTIPLVPRTVEGRWEANRPTHHRFAESPVDAGGRFAFHRGALQEFAFDRGGELFERTSARRLRRSHPLAAVALGLNPRIVRAPEVGDLALGAVSLRFGRPLEAGPGGPGAPAYVSVLRGADVEVDGRPWLAEGRATRSAPR